MYMFIFRVGKVLEVLEQFNLKINTLYILLPVLMLGIQVGLEMKLGFLLYTTEREF